MGCQKKWLPICRHRSSFDALRHWLKKQNCRITEELGRWQRRRVKLYTNFRRTSSLPPLTMSRKALGLLSCAVLGQKTSRKSILALRGLQMPRRHWRHWPPSCLLRLAFLSTDNTATWQTQQTLHVIGERFSAATRLCSLSLDLPALWHNVDWPYKCLVQSVCHTPGLTNLSLNLANSNLHQPDTWQSIALSLSSTAAPLSHLHLDLRHNNMASYDGLCTLHCWPTRLRAFKPCISVSKTTRQRKSMPASL